ncbi:MAG: sigma-70 family RNA polymerase sigma factor [Phycisphaeraceae bacterium]|nr:sigma-70 family RNA polymerase sigma factor [Phycisphaeraceae bacterium]
MMHLTDIPTTEATTSRRRIAPKPSSEALSDAERETARQILDQPYDFTPHKLFSKRDREAERAIFHDAPSIPTPDTSWYNPVMEGIGESRSMNQGSVLLTASQEQALFLQFNYCRYRAAQLRQRLQKQGRLAPTTTRKMLFWHSQAAALRDQIADTNLALVLAMAKRARLNDMDFADLVSEGNMALLRAVDKFDAARGFKFSTYACRAILKAFSRAGMKMTRHRQMFPTDFDPTMERSNYMEVKRDGHEDDCAGEVKDIVLDNRADLTDIEQEVIEHRFALNRAATDKPRRPLTLEQVGRIIGVTKERVRQIQNKALAKIRASLEDDFLR